MQGLLWVCVLAYLLVGCTLAHTRQSSGDIARQLGMADQAQVQRGGNWVLAANSRVYLAFPQSPETVHQTYPRLALSVFDALQEHLSGHFAQVQLAPWQESRDDSWQRAAEQSVDFLLVPHILAREDQLSSVREIHRDWQVSSAYGGERRVGRDRVSLRLQVYDLRSRRLLDTLTVHVVSSRIAWAERTPQILAQHAALALTQPLLTP